VRAIGLFKRKPPTDGASPLPALEDRLAVWEREDRHLAELCELAHRFRGDTADQIERTPIALKAGERVYAIVNGAQLIEPRSPGGHWEGGSQGISVRIPGTRSARYRVGATRGHYVRATEEETPIDTGTAVVTDRRVAFAGAKQAREWLWSKCLGIEHQPDAPWTAIAVSNRQRTSGIFYGEEAAPTVRFRIDLAFAVATGEDDDLAAELDAERAQHAARRPGSPLPPPSAPGLAAAPLAAVRVPPATSQSGHA
jgi:hypothetical protein